MKAITFIGLVDFVFAKPTKIKSLIICYKANSASVGPFLLDSCNVAFTKADSNPTTSNTNNFQDKVIFESGCVPSFLDSSIGVLYFLPQVNQIDLDILVNRVQVSLVANLNFPTITILIED
jgi:hypothetical protein